MNSICFTLMEKIDLNDVFFKPGAIAKKNNLNVKILIIA